MPVLSLASGAGGRIAIGLRYDAETLAITAVEASNLTDRMAVVTLTHGPSGVTATRNLPARIPSVQPLPAGWTVAVGPDGVSVPDLAVSVSFWAGED